MLERIVKVIKAYREIEFPISEETTFKELGLDSLDTVELVMTLEEEFDVSIEVNESIQSIGDLLKVIHELTNEGSI